MPSSVSAASVKQEGAPPSLASERVRQGLSGRRISATPEQEKRLAKILERLEPTAHGVMAAGLSGAGSEVSFSVVLVQLSHA